MQKLTKKNKSEVARCASEIKQVLKKEYPEIKFSVRSESYSGGNSVNVSYKMGLNVPSPKEIEKKLSKYQYGHVDLMQDYYEISNSRDDIPQTKYLFVNLEETRTFLNNYKDAFLKHWGFKEWDDREILAKLDKHGDQALYRFVWDHVLKWER